MEPQRVNDDLVRINSFNEAINKTYERVQATHGEMMTRTEDIDNRVISQKETHEAQLQELGAYVMKQKAQLEGMKATAEAKFKMLRDELKQWISKVHVEIEPRLSNTPPGLGTEAGSAHKGKIDRKEVAIWELSDGVSTADFRHWADQPDLHLEAVHGLNNPDVLLDKVRRYPTEVTEKVPDDIFATIHSES